MHPLTTHFPRSSIVEAVEVAKDLSKAEESRKLENAEKELDPGSASRSTRALCAAHRDEELERKASDGVDPEPAACNVLAHDKRWVPHPVSVGRVVASVKGQHDIEDEEADDADDPPLGPEEARLYRGIAARLNYIAPDRPDIGYAVKESARAMA